MIWMVAYFYLYPFIASYRIYSFIGLGLLCCSHVLQSAQFRLFNRPYPLLKENDLPKHNTVISWYFKCSWLAFPVFPLFCTSWGIARSCVIHLKNQKQRLAGNVMDTGKVKWRSMRRIYSSVSQRVGPGSGGTHLWVVEEYYCVAWHVSLLHGHPCCLHFNLKCSL